MNGRKFENLGYRRWFQGNLNSRKWYLDQKVIFSGGCNGNLCFWSETGKALHYPYLGVCTSLPRGETFPVEMFQMVNLEKFERSNVKIIPPQPYGLYDIKYMEEYGRVIACGEKNMFVINARQKTLLSTLSGHTNRPYRTANLTSGNIGSVSFDNTVKFWNLEKSRCYQTIRSHKDFTVDIDVDREKRQIFTSSYDETVRIHSERTGKQIMCIPCNTNVYGLCFLGDNQLVIGENTGGRTKRRSGYVRLFLTDTRTGKFLQTWNALEYFGEVGQYFPAVGRVIELENRSILIRCDKYARIFSLKNGKYQLNKSMEEKDQVMAVEKLNFYTDSNQSLHGWRDEIAKMEEPAAAPVEKPLPVINMKRQPKRQPPKKRKDNKTRLFEEDELENMPEMSKLRETVLKFDPFKILDGKFDPKSWCQGKGVLFYHAREKNAKKVLLDFIREHKEERKEFQQKSISFVMKKQPFASGGERHAYIVKILGIRGFDKKVYVGKRFQKDSENEDKSVNVSQTLTLPRSYLNVVSLHKICGILASFFCKKLRDKGERGVKVRYIPSFLLMMESQGPQKRVICSLEEAQKGEWERFNDNSGSFADNFFHPIPQAFSHFTHDISDGYCIVCDIQGVCVSEKEYILSDPAIHTKDMGMYESDGNMTNLGVPGMNACLKVHKCNEYCKKLGLKEIVIEEVDEVDENFQEELGFEGDYDIDFDDL